MHVESVLVFGSVLLSVRESLTPSGFDTGISEVNP